MVIGRKEGTKEGGRVEVKVGGWWGGVEVCGERMGAWGSGWGGMGGGERMKYFMGSFFHLCRTQLTREAYDQKAALQYEVFTDRINVPVSELVK